MGLHMLLFRQHHPLQNAVFKTVIHATSNLDPTAGGKGRFQPGS
jgi:hypothetical protein